MSPIRTLRVVKDKMKPAEEAFTQILEQLGIKVVSIKRGGENYEFVFDRDLTKEEAGKLTAIKNILKTKFPDHKIIEVEEE